MKKQNNDCRARGFEKVTAVHTVKTGGKSTVIQKSKDLRTK